MGQFHWDPESYTAIVRAEVPDYDRVQDEVARATEGVTARRVLELGTGTGVTARAVLERHPRAHLTGVDSSEHMLAVAALPGADLRLQDLRAALPEGPFDLVFSALARPPPRGAPTRPTSSRASPPRSRPAGASCSPTSSSPRIRPTSSPRSIPASTCPRPSPTCCGWMTDAGLRARISWQARDLAVLAGDAAVG